MKIRNGFVSNSSSSSFIALVPKEEFDKLKSTYQPLTQAVIEKVSSKKTFMGIECVSFTFTQGNYSDMEWITDDKKDVYKRAAKISGGKESDFDMSDYDQVGILYAELNHFEDEIASDGRFFTEVIDF